MSTLTGERSVNRVADGFHYLEGPRWHRGRLYFADFYGHTVYSVGAEGRVDVVCPVPAQPSGLGFDSEGRLLVVSMLDRRLLRFEAGVPTEIADLTEIAPGPLNDMVVDEHGRAYIGNFGSDLTNGEEISPTSLVRVGLDGRAEVASEELVFPNGMVITPDGKTLIVAESFAFRISAFDIAADGALSARRIWAKFAERPAPDISAVLNSDAVIPDGLCMDEDGALWVADAKGSGALRIREGGEVVDFVSTGDLAVFAVALGGEDRRTLFMCAGPPLGAIDATRERLGVLLSSRVEVPGAGLP